MDRGWYLRFTFTAALIVVAGLALWPSVDAWLPQAAKAPAWLTGKYSSRIAPGLDVQGGLRLTYEVEVDEAVRKELLLTLGAR